MAKTKYEKELEKESQGPLVRMCEGKGLNHTGNKEALIAQLVEAEQAESKQAEEPVGEPGPEDGPPATETEVESPAPEPETPEPED